MSTWQRTTLGRTGLDVCRLGLAASYGCPAAAVEQAFERGVNYMYWGSMRKGGFADGLRNLRPQRERIVLVLQSYSRIAGLVGWSLERALRSLQYDYADVLLLGLWNHAIPPKIMDASLELKHRGLVRHIAISTHHRPLIPQLARSKDIGIFHVRYNAVHPGAEQDIFPHLPVNGSRPGIVAYTATSWRQLLDPKRVPSGERIPTATDCYRFALSNPSVDLCMTGPANLEQTLDGMQALERGPLDEAELAWMHRIGAAIHK
jgi:aryl-alcohol dehydrogenase-like predicted oxidoreductase